MQAVNVIYPNANIIEEELIERVEEFEAFYEMAVGRELKMKELKDEIAKLKSELSRYKP